MCWLVTCYALKMNHCASFKDHSVYLCYTILWFTATCLVYGPLCNILMLLLHSLYILEFISILMYQMVCVNVTATQSTNDLCSPCAYHQKMSPNICILPLHIPHPLVLLYVYFANLPLPNKHVY